MEKKSGIHFYVEVKNLLDIIKDEESKDDDLKRTLHRLNTFFTGFSALIKEYGGKVEKYTGGRAHVSFEDNLEDGCIDENVMEAMIACYIYTNNIFNQLGKYSQYPAFQVHGGIDYGEFYDHTIIENDGSEEYTSIGSVANNSAKIQFYAKKDYIYATGKLVENLSDEIKEKFVEMSVEEKAEFSSKLKDTSVFKAKYTDVFDASKRDDMEASLKDIKEKVKNESNALNLSDITFESCAAQLNFSNLSLKGKNKRLECGAVVCADIRGFTKLFESNDSNLDNLKDVMEEFYKIMGTCADDTQGTKVQYQGDRIVVVYNDYSGAEDAALRAIKCAFTLNQKIQELDADPQIKLKLNYNSIGIGIGCGWGKIIATRLGGFGCKDNIVLSEAYQMANKAEDQYAEAGQTVIGKKLKEYIDQQVKEGLDEFGVLQDMFKAISTTGMYVSEATINEYVQKLEELKELQEEANKVALNRSYQEPRPWGSNLCS